MLNIKNQIDYWVNGADEAFQTAELLINQKRLLHGLFFCHLAIEKILKALFVKINQSIAPKTHNLIYLSEKLDFTFDDEKEIFLGILMKYQLEGRYPDYNPFIPDIEVINNYLIKTSELLIWLKAKL